MSDLNDTAKVHKLGTSLGAPEGIVRSAREQLDKLVAGGAREPNRGDLDAPTHKWRHGKPNYSIANLAYLKGKRKNHAKGSLEEIVENLVKTWEMEASHKKFPDWLTVQHDVYSSECNGGKKYKGEEAADVGTYNWLLDSCPKEKYDASKETFATSHTIFESAFPDGFVWEVLEVFSGPPVCGFSWRHWADFTGDYKGKKGTGQLVEMTGFTIATLNSDLKIQHLQVFFKSEEFFEALENPKAPAGGITKLVDSIKCCPFLKDH